MISFLFIRSIVSGQDKRCQISDYGLTFYFDTTDNGIAKTVYGNRYIRIYYLKDDLWRVECYRSSDSSIIEKGNYILDTIPRIKIVKGRDIDTGTEFTERISYYELKRRGLWCFYNKRVL